MAFIADFPLIHSAAFIKKEVINTYSLLYTVEGTTKGKLPYLLASHLDVVPVDPSTWEVPPFGGKIVNRTYIYGRGAIDDKSGVLVSEISKKSSAGVDHTHSTVIDIPWIPYYVTLLHYTVSKTYKFIYHFKINLSYTFDTTRRLMKKWSKNSVIEGV